MSTSTEVARVEAGAVVPMQSEAFLSVIARAAADPSINVEKMQSLLDMQMRIMERQAEAAFNEAMARLQPKLPRIVREGKASYGQGKGGYNYARYEDIDRMIRPLLNEEGFALSFDSVWNDKLCTIIGKLSHSGGHSTAASIPLPLDTSGGKNGIQGMGSTLSYGKRYCVGMLLNIVTVGEDDDATYEACKNIDTGGYAPGTKEAQDYVAAKKLADLAVHVDDVPNTPAKPKAAKPKTTTNFKALEAIGDVKADLKKLTGNDDEYYRILKDAAGVMHANQILDIEVQRTLYKLLAARRNDLMIEAQAPPKQKSEDDMLREQYEREQQEGGT